MLQCFLTRLANIKVTFLIGLLTNASRRVSYIEENMFSTEELSNRETKEVIKILRNVDAKKVNTK
jgi:hypothetical protein